MMKRSQIYLPLEQWRVLSALSHRMHRSVSELIRRAVDRAYKRKNGSDWAGVLAQTAGLWGNRTDLPPTPAYIRRLRRDRRSAFPRTVRHA